MTQFKYTCETPNKFVGGDVHSNDLATIKGYCIDMAIEHTYSAVRDNVTGEIVFDQWRRFFASLSRVIV